MIILCERERQGACLHCKYRKAGEDRLLCHACRCDPIIREKYRQSIGPRARGGNRGYGIDNTIYRPLPKPTQAIPGTDEKIAVMRERARLNQQLFHPFDAQLDSDVA